MCAGQEDAHYDLAGHPDRENNFEDMDIEVNIIL